jgi:hypothetical protein
MSSEEQEGHYAIPSIGRNRKHLLKLSAPPAAMLQGCLVLKATGKWEGTIGLARYVRHQHLILSIFETIC